MKNSEIAAGLEEMAILLELAGENPFRVRAYQRAARTCAALSRPLAEIPDEELLEIEGIGKGIAAHIGELCKKGTLGDLLALRRRFPQGLLELLKVPGLGPKRARFLFQELGIHSADKLREASQAGKLRALKGFGPKLEANILRGLSFAAEASRRALYWDAKVAMDEIVASLRGLPGVEKISPAGSLRRGRETVGDLDVLCAAADGASVIERFTRLPQVERVLGAGGTKATVWLKSGQQCDLRVVPAASFGAALQYFTGSKEHNVALRELAQRQGLTVNEYGVFSAADAAHGRPLAGRTEEEVYKRLGLAFIPPELRENRGEIDAARNGRLPELIELKDVRGDFHNHSNYTDGMHTLAEMAQAADRLGWEWVALGDHSRSLRVASGLSVNALKKTIAEVRRLQEKTRARLLRSMEVDILADGEMDYPEAVLEEIDVVIASVHSRFSQPEEEMTARIVRAIENPGVDIVGHVSGRLLNRREPYRVDVEALLGAAARAGTAFEINGQPQRQELADVHARRARDLGVKLAVTTDAHAAAQFQYMELAVTIARRAWLTKKDVLNCMGYDELREWLDRRRARPAKAAPRRSA